MDAIADSEIRWFYAKGGAKHGPFTPRALKDLLRDGGITWETLVWRQGFPEWKQASQTDLLDNLTPDLPPPLPPSHVDNKLAWIIAAVPLIGALIERIVLDNSSSNNQTTIILFSAYFAAYTILILLDATQIKKSGHNPNDISLAAWFWIVPVYLYKRATALGQVRIYFFFWIGAFVAATLIQQPTLFSETTYWGSGVPACDSNYARKQVKTIFKDIPLVKLSSLLALEVISANQIATNGEKRNCRAVVRASNGNDVPVAYTVERTNDQIYISVNISQ